jgi:S1-C subfamily serine protease
MKLKLFFLLCAGLLFAGPGRADLAATIAKVKPSVVIVGTYKSTDRPRFGLRGTGFVVAPGNPAQGTLVQGNLVITNAHVLQQAAKDDAPGALVIQIRGGPREFQMRTTTVLQIDALHDLALLRFDGPPAPALTVHDSDTVQEGQAVAFMGFPIGGALGFSSVTHRAIVSSIAAMALPTPSAHALNQQVIRSLRGGESFDIFQLDGTAYPGNSGGPLFDPDTGAVLGVVNMVFVKGTRESALSRPSGISYAIPSAFVLQLLQREQHK